MQRGRSRHTLGYPVVEINFYGPTNSRATKVVVEIVGIAGAPPGRRRPWTARGVDIRNRIDIVAADKARFLSLKGRIDLHGISKGADGEPAMDLSVTIFQT